VQITFYVTTCCVITFLLCNDKFRTQRTHKFFPGLLKNTIRHLCIYMTRYEKVCRTKKKEKRKRKGKEKMVLHRDALGMGGPPLHVRHVAITGSDDE
jgi:hypothetical protein